MLALILFSFIFKIFILQIQSSPTISTVPPTWVYSPYFRADQYQIVNTFQRPTDPPATYHFLFNPVFSNNPNVVYGLKQYRGYDTFWEENYQCKRFGILDTTGFSVQFIIINPTSVYYISIAYVAIDGTFPHHIRSFQNKPINWGTTLSNINVNSPANRAFTNQIDYHSFLISQGYAAVDFPAPLSNVQILMYQTSAYYEDHTRANELDYSITYTIDDASHFTIVVSIKNTVMINSMQFSMLIFNTQQIVLTGKYQVVFGYVTLAAPGGTFVSGYNVQKAFVMGIFTMKSARTGCSIQYSWSIAGLNPLTIRIDMPLPLAAASATCALSQTTSVYFYLRQWFCPTPYNYFNVTTDLCQNLCDMGYYENLTDYVCYPCNVMPNCYDCSSNVACDICNTGFSVGSRSDCEPCPGGVCPINPVNPVHPTNPTSSCPLNFTFQSLIKDPTSNNIDINFKTDINVISSVYALGLSDTELKNSISQNTSKVTIQKFIMDNSSNTITMVFSYNETIHGQMIAIYFISSLATLFNGCTQYIETDPSNNIPAVYYAQNIYDQRAVAQAIFRFAQISGYIILILSLIPAKIIGIQLFGVLQLAFFSLAQQDNINIILSPLMKMKQLNGLNIPVNQNQNITPERVSSLSIQGDFINNCNAMFFVVIGQLLIAAIIFLISANFPNKIPSLLGKVSKYMLKQILLTLILFNVFNMSFSTTLQFIYGDSNQQDYIFSLVLSISSIILVLGIVFGILFTQSKQFGQYKNKFKNDFPSSNYIFLTVIYRCALGSYIASMNQFQISSIVIIGFSMAFLIYDLVNLPFKNVYHNYRASICHVTFLIILFVAMYYRSMKSSDTIEEISYHNGPAYVEIGAILLCLTVSFMMLIYQGYIFINKMIKKFSQDNKNDSGDSDKLQYKSDKEQMKKKQNDESYQNTFKTVQLQSKNQINIVFEENLEMNPSQKVFLEQNKQKSEQI